MHRHSARFLSLYQCHLNLPTRLSSSRLEIDSGAEAVLQEPERPGCRDHGKRLSCSSIRDSSFSIAYVGGNLPTLEASVCLKLHSTDMLLRAESVTITGYTVE